MWKCCSLDVKVIFPGCESMVPWKWKYCSLDVKVIIITRNILNKIKITTASVYPTRYSERFVIFKVAVASTLFNICWFIKCFSYFILKLQFWTICFRKFDHIQTIQTSLICLYKNWKRILHVSGPNWGVEGRILLNFCDVALIKWFTMAHFFYWN